MMKARGMALDMTPQQEDAVFKRLRELKARPTKNSAEKMELKRLEDQAAAIHAEWDRPETVNPSSKEQKGITYKGPH